jgi:hypothetical protein
MLLGLSLHFFYALLLARFTHLGNLFLWSCQKCWRLNSNFQMWPVSDLEIWSLFSWLHRSLTVVSGLQLIAMVISASFIYIKDVVA